MIKFQQVIRDLRRRRGTRGRRKPIRRSPKEKPIRNRWRRLNIFHQWCPSSSHHTSRQLGSTVRRSKAWSRIPTPSWSQNFKAVDRTLPRSRVQTQLLQSLISSTFSNGSRVQCERMRNATKHKRVHTRKTSGNHRCRTADSQIKIFRSERTVLTTSSLEPTI